MSMVRKQLYIDEDLNEGLRMVAARTGRSEAEHVRAALRAYLELERTASGGGENPLLDLVGLVDDTDGPEDVAHRHDDYLYGDGSRPVNRSA
jgi:Ribbon-helix-helix protein, copG family